MKDDRYSEEERRAKEEAYREYLRLRQEAPKVSITETPYGASALRKKQREEEDARAAYEAAREAAKGESRGRRFPGRADRRRREEGRSRREPERPQRDGERPRREARPRREEDLRRADAQRTRRGTERPRRSGQQAAYGADQARREGRPYREEDLRRADAQRAYREARQSGRSEEQAYRGAQRSRRSEEQTYQGAQRTRREPAPLRRESARPRRRSQMEQQKPMPIAENTSEETIRTRDQRDRTSGGGGGRGPKKRTGMRRAAIIAAAVLAALIALFAGAFIVAASTLSSIGSLDIDKHNIGISDQAKSTLKDYENIAVLGVDSRDMEDDTDSRSDAMVIVSINKKTDEVKMFSVFRDTLLDLGDDHGLDKITHAYAYGGAELTLYTLNHNIDLNIKKAVVINWKTVAEIIDTIGGIEIDVQESEIDEINKYVGGTAKRTGSEKIKVEHAGKQTLNGAQAVTYARIRKDAVTGDYRRNERMKVVMATTFKKLKESDLMTIKEVCDNALPQAKTNLSTTEMMKLGLKFKKLNMTSSTTGWPYDVEGWIGTAGGGAAWYGPPVTLESNVKKLYKKFFGISGYEPTMEVKSISEEISALTGLY